MIRWFLVPMLLWACETMPSSGEVWAPAVQSQPLTEEGVEEAPQDVATVEDRVPGEPDPDQEEASTAPTDALDAHLLEITGTPDEAVPSLSSDELDDPVEPAKLAAVDLSPIASAGHTSASWGCLLYTSPSPRDRG